MLHDLETQNQFSCRDVIFYEDIFPNSEPTKPCSTTTAEPSTRSTTIFDDIIPIVVSPITSLPTAASQDSGSNEQGTNTDFSVTVLLQSDSGGVLSSPNSTFAEINIPESDSLATENVVPPTQSNAEETPSGRPVRQHHQPAYMKDYHCRFTHQYNDPHATSSSSVESGIRFPIANYASCARFSDTHTEFLAAITAGTEPTTYKQASTHEHWRLAMQTELDTLQTNNTWCMMSLPLGKKAIGSKWVYRIK